MSRNGFVLDAADAATVFDPPVKGQPWNLRSPSSLPSIPRVGSPGYGCFVAPSLPLGYPLLANASVPCAAGMFCPYHILGDPNTQPVGCPASGLCTLLRMQTLPCLPQGRYEPMPCPAGFYCPDPWTITVCPEGYYCITGSTTPRACAPFSICPAGTAIQTHYGLLLLALLIDIVLAVFMIVQRAMEARLAGSPMISILPLFIQSLLGQKVTKSPKIGNGDKVIGSVSGNLIDCFRDAMSEGVTGAADGAETRMEFDFEKMRLVLPNGVCVLEGVTGAIHAGRMTAIMGPSGAGKTTFMNVLMGKVARTGGELRINGVSAEMQAFKKIIGYVPQEDVMLRELTCRENILYAARTRLPGSWNDRKVVRHVNNVIESLGLSRVQHTQIGDDFSRGVSGGQRKRVNVGIELAAAPLAVFLDEPTSGLDSTSALDLSNILSSISRLGLTIVAVIHQPRAEIFLAFDDILLLAPGGRTAYLGPTANVRQYFESLNFVFPIGANDADVLMDILSGKGTATVSPAPTPDDIVRAWTARDEAQLATRVKTSETDDTPAVARMHAMVKTRGAGWARQLLLSHNRSLLQQSRFLGAFSLELFVGSFAGSIMGVSANTSEPYWGVLLAPYSLLSTAPVNWFIALFGMLIGIAIALAGGPSGVKVFGEEKPVYWREAASGHNKSAYYIGKTIAVLYRIMLSSLHFTAFYYFFARPPMGIGIQYVVILLNFFCIYGVSVIISMLVRRENAPLLSVIVGLFMAVFCGFGLSITDATDGGYVFIFDLGANRWAAEINFLGWVEQYAAVYDISNALEFCGYEAGRTGFNLGMMVVLGVAYRIIGYVLMVLLNRDKQK